MCRVFEEMGFLEGGLQRRHVEESTRVVTLVGWLL